MLLDLFFHLPSSTHASVKDALLSSLSTTPLFSKDIVKASLSQVKKDSLLTLLSKVIIANDLKSSNHCIEAVKKSQKLLGYIKRQFRTRNKETILTLYNALVRPHLEYAIQFWSLSLRKDIERLEAVQARSTKLIPSIKTSRICKETGMPRLILVRKASIEGPGDRNI